VTDHPSAERQRFWLARKIGELRTLLERLPPDRRRAFRDLLDAPSDTESDDRMPGMAEAEPGGDRASAAGQTRQRGE
jgi:hypothetical protein